MHSFFDQLSFSCTVYSHWLMVSPSVQTKTLSSTDQIGLLLVSRSSLVGNIGSESQLGPACDILAIGIGMCDISWKHPSSSFFCPIMIDKYTVSRCDSFDGICSCLVCGYSTGPETLLYCMSCKIVTSENRELPENIYRCINTAHHEYFHFLGHLET